MFYNDVHQSGTSRWVIDCGEYFLEEKLTEFGLSKGDADGFIFAETAEICPHDVVSWSTGDSDDVVKGDVHI